MLPHVAAIRRGGGTVATTFRQTGPVYGRCEVVAHAPTSHQGRPTSETGLAAGERPNIGARGGSKTSKRDTPEPDVKLLAVGRRAEGVHGLPPEPPPRP